jgi:hypothetical protein
LFSRTSQSTPPVTAVRGRNDVVGVSRRAALVSMKPSVD